MSRGMYDPSLVQHEVCEEEEAETEPFSTVDRRLSAKKCIKNPGHPNFIPVKEFNPFHLPEDTRDEELFRLVMFLIHLTVKVTNKHISERRPEYCKGTDQKYPFADNRGQYITICGTGTCRFVKMIYAPSKWCECQKCTTLHKRGKVVARIMIYTAKHVVYDKIEAQHSTVTFNYDDSTDAGVSFRVVDVEKTRVDSDFTCLIIDVCDVKMAEGIKKMRDELYKLCQTVRKKYKDKGKKLTIIVSHPHGCSKHISVGEWLERERHEGRMTNYSYTACTCPGSSGALVYTLGWRGWKSAHVHCGVIDLVNVSAKGGDEVND
ncbi:uncharacterized protein LOC131942727 [Physella acuta]|uniref:uncharacterized protein LOC131942727 n=1 Tax=Physella acuta TaxID=109671 RepID=UPI0027DD2278|nr:uncharacterized protein LOC131942727 [Physella acuta]